MIYLKEQYEPIHENELNIPSWNYFEIRDTVKHLFLHLYTHKSWHKEGLWK